MLGSGNDSDPLDARLRHCARRGLQGIGLRSRWRYRKDAVVVPGSRAVKKGHAAEWNLSLYTPVIVKYRDEKTDRGIELEDWLR